MEKEFVPYEQALALKELGFDKPCLASYETAFGKGIDFELGYIIDGPKNYVLTPLYQQAFRWFREKYDLHGITFKNRKNMLYNEGIKTHSYTIMGSYNDILYNTLSNEYKLSFEEAELECLKELIKIVNNN